MSTMELRKRLIEKIQKTDNVRLLEEAVTLFELETQDIKVHKLTDDQQRAIDEAKQQIKNGQFLTDEQANREVDELLNE